MASMRDIKRRRDSIESTEQITKAMKLVATVKLQKARSRAESAKPYTDHMYSTMCSILSRSGNLNHRFLNPGESEKSAVLLITSNRGLAGGYNSNIIKTVINSDLKKEDILLYSVGRKGMEYLMARGYHIEKDYSEVINAPLYKDAIELSEVLLKKFEKGEIGSIYLAYTQFKNTVSHVPTMLRLLPVDTSKIVLEDAPVKDLPMNYEPDDEEVLDSIVPQYMASLIYGALLECVASENGARMTAMDAATDNAEEMISKLSLDYNRARQGAITQELTEIIAGSQAIS